MDFGGSRGCSRHLFGRGIGKCDVSGHWEVWEQLHFEARRDIEVFIKFQEFSPLSSDFQEGLYPGLQNSKDRGAGLQESFLWAEGHRHDENVERLIWIVQHLSAWTVQICPIVLVQYLILVPQTHLFPCFCCIHFGEFVFETSFVDTIFSGVWRWRELHAGSLFLWHTNFAQRGGGKWNYAKNDDCAILRVCRMRLISCKPTKEENCGGSVNEHRDLQCLRHKWIWHPWRWSSFITMSLSSRTVRCTDWLKWNSSLYFCAGQSFGSVATRLAADVWSSLCEVLPSINHVAREDLEPLRIWKKCTGVFPHCFLPFCKMNLWDLYFDKGSGVWWDKISLRHARIRSQMDVGVQQADGIYKMVFKMCWCLESRLSDCLDVSLIIFNLYEYRIHILSTSDAPPPSSTSDL